MARGNARQRIVGDDHDRERLLDDLRRTVLRCGWELLAFVFMENHLHLLLKTPRPNLARGMQQFLSSYAIRHGRRHRRVGHLFQGRYRRGRVSDFVLGSYVLCSKPKTKSDSAQTKSDSAQMVSVRQAGMPEPRPIYQTLVDAG